MTAKGITRIHITDQPNGRGAWRFEESLKRQPEADRLYREIFRKLSMPLLDGDETICCTKAEFEAGYDYQLGIDVILTLHTGQELTLQEKFLYTKYKTVTVEYWQDWRRQIPGDYFKIKANCYFVGYDRNKSLTFQEYILLNWPMVQTLDAQGKLGWTHKQNTQDGARASFVYLPMVDFPASCVYDRYDASRVQRPRPAVQQTFTGLD